jgi:hypothetical protein
MLRQKWVRGLVAIAACAFVNACHDQPTAPKVDNIRAATLAVNRVIALDDPCWTYATANCESYSSAGTLIDAARYDYLGGLDPCYNGSEGGCGSGFGQWDAAAEGCFPSYPAGPCLIATAGRHPNWVGCPGRIVFNSWNVVNGASEYWELTKTENFTMLGVSMAAYVGTYTRGGVTVDAIGEMICAVGFVAAGANVP